MGRRIQRLRSRLGRVHRGVSSHVVGVRSRVATTLTSIRERSYAYAGFPTSRQLLGPAGQEDGTDAADARCMQLRNTIVK
jgi:hypothetical protein